ncbi:GNAT family N-acetyltransferase [Rhizocola hellebori]|uniref:GNAT family N-acetyltransferase n=1 Tax=Rhizocola hellebori TaxID=1392758 RepID=A0A8J3QC20_9ACTN|nr:GNAT family N-acetyltransferase [Rhizocola hellebori]GIH07875.1 GNAT family N-acetyltransferase [Rhizocola hellebori]
MTDMLSADGRIMRLREVTADDAGSLLDLYHNSSDDSRYKRFLYLGRAAAQEEVDRLTRAPGTDHFAILAEDQGQVIGAASYERLEEGFRADFAVMVGDQWQGHGVGTLLVEQLAAHARQHGVQELVGDVLAVNSSMLRVAAGISPGAPVEYDGTVSKVRIATAFDSAALAAMDARERSAEEHSLRPMLAPRSVAVVGVGRKPGGVGRELLANILGHGFTGRVYAVNPHADAIDGCLTVPTVAQLPEAVDLLVVAVPAAAVAEVIREAGVVGVRAAVIVTSGFTESGADGRAAQREVLDIARRCGMRLLGPNCLGLINADPAIRLAATFAADLPDAFGGLAVAAQSGAVGIAVLDHAKRHGLGIASFVSLGNKADVSGNDMLSYWFDDPAVRAVALYLESFGNPRKFARIARAVARRKPVLAVKGGRSTGGQRAGASHTAAAAAPAVAVDSLFAQAGVVRADSLGEMLDAARVLVDQPLPGGNRVGLVGNAGGLNVLGADAAEAAGLTVPDLPEHCGNPNDLGAGASPRAMGEAIRAMAASRQVDMIVAIFAATRSNEPGTVMLEIAAAADEFPDLAFAVVIVGADAPPTQLGKRRAPVFALPEQAMRALGHAVRYAAWREHPLGNRPTLPDIEHDRAQSIVDTALAGGEGWQSWNVAADLLSCYGVTVLPSAIVESADEAIAAAERLGYPVALKAADPNLVHKTELGAVHLRLADAEAVAHAYRAIGIALANPQPPVVVQPMRGGGVEMVAGVVHDPLFGSLLMTGLGGVHTDLLADRSLQLLPVTDRDAEAMWKRLRGAKLLTGYRGSPAVDTEALQDVLLRLGRLAEDFPQVAELDLNPLLVFPHSVTAVDVKLRLCPVGTELDPSLRALRAQ